MRKLFRYRSLKNEIQLFISEQLVKGNFFSAASRKIREFSPQCTSNRTVHAHDFWTFFNDLFPWTVLMCSTWPWSTCSSSGDTVASQLLSESATFKTKILWTWFWATASRTLRQWWKNWLDPIDNTTPPAQSFSPGQMTRSVFCYKCVLQLI